MNCTIMVADKSEIIREMLAEVLSDEGFAVRGYPAEQVTPDVIASETPNLVILDLCRNDAEATLLLLKKLRHRPAARAIAIVITSTDPALLDTLAEPLNHLDCVTLIKPFELDELLECVMKALGRKLAVGERFGMKTDVQLYPKRSCRAADGA